MIKHLLSASPAAQSPKVVVAHLGAHKTATSLVQQFFDQEQESFAEQGLHYISRGTVKPAITWGNKVEKDPKLLNDLLKSRAKKVQGDYLMFSNENALGRPLKRKPGLYPASRRFIPAYLKAFDGFQPRIVYTVRPPWEFLESYYMQMINQGYHKRFNQFLKRVDLHELSWRPMVEQMIETFGRENVVIQDFSLIRQGQDVFISEFLRRAVAPGIEAPNTYSTVHNASLSQRGLRIAMRVNPLLKGCERGLVRRFLQAHFSNQNEPRPELLTPDLKAELIERYAKDYEALIAEG